MLSVSFKQYVLTQHHWLDRIGPGQRLLRGKWYSLVKRVMDLLIALLALPLILPLLLLCAILIKLEGPRGPIFFVQEHIDSQHFNK